MAKSRKPKSRQGKKKNPSLPKGRGGRFLSKEDKAFREKELKERKADKEVLTGKRERLARTRTKSGTGRAHLKEKYKAPRVETNEKIGKTRKRTLTVRGNAAEAREEIKRFLLKYGRGKNTLSQVAILTKQGSNTSYGSKLGSAIDTYSYLETTGKEYGKKFGVTESSNITYDLVIISQ